MVAKFCIDIGGTRIKSAFVDGKKITSYKEFATPKKHGEFLTKIVELIRKRVGVDDKIRIAIASPVLAGKVKEAPHLPIHDFDLAAYLRQQFRNEIKIENDARCAALAHSELEGLDNFVFLSFGTGVGGAVFMSGKLSKATNYEGEIGHMIIHGKELEELWRAKTKDKSYVAEALGLIQNSLHPETIVLSSRVIKNKKDFINSLQAFTSLSGKPKIVWSKMKYPELLGAALL